MTLPFHFFCLALQAIFAAGSLVMVCITEDVGWLNIMLYNVLGVLIQLEIIMRIDDGPPTIPGPD